jgi:hypothetical protein
LRDERRHDSLRRESDALALALAIADTFTIAETVGPDSATWSLKGYMASMFSMRRVAVGAR